MDQMEYGCGIVGNGELKEEMDVKCIIMKPGR